MQSRIAPTTEAGAATLEAARGVFDQLDRGAAKAEADRRLPPETVEAMRAAHVFRMPMPAAWGGPELPIVDMLLVLEELAYADGSAGWCAMIGCDSGFYAAKLEDAVAREVFDDLDLVTAGQTSPAGHAVPEGDGWRITGRWAFGSGCTHADRIVGGAFLLDADGNRLAEPDGMPSWRTFVLPIDEVTLHETWDPTGLAGTGSHDYSVDGCGCPTSTPCGPWIRPCGMARSTRSPGRSSSRALRSRSGWPAGRSTSSPPSRPASWCSLSSPSSATSTTSTTAWRAAGALIASSKALIHDVVGAAWDEIERTGELQQEGRADLRLAMVHCTTACRTAVGHVVDTATTAAIKRGSPIDRAHRDIVTASQHLVVNDRVYGMVGRVLMGKPAGVIMV